MSLNALQTPETPLKPAHPALRLPVMQLPPLVSDAETQNNRAANEALIRELEQRTQSVLNQGSGRTQQLHLSRGMLLARDRIALLLDQDSPFLQLCTFAGYEQKDCTPSGSVVGGIGLVSNTLTMCIAHIPTLQGASANRAQIAKIQRLGQIAHENRLPIVFLVHSAGASLQQQFEFHHGARQFYDLATRSQDGIPTCSVVFGQCPAAGAYTPGMSDMTIMIREQAQLFLGGPPLVKMATGEVSNAEELGGAEKHATVSGVADCLVNNEVEAITEARYWVASLNWGERISRPESLRLPQWDSLEPLYSMDSLLDVAQANIKKPWRIEQLIARITDGSRFNEFKPLYGANTVTGFAYVAGHPVGIIGNNGVLNPSDAQKTTQFIRLANNNNVPLLFLHNISGFMVGREFEAAGSIKYGSLLINAVANSKVPHISIIVGSSYGAGNCAMCGRAYDPRFLFTWPQGRTSVMGPDALAGVVDMVEREILSRSGKPIDEARQQKRREAMFNKVSTESDAYYASSRMMDDGIIDPRSTRQVVGFCLEIFAQEKIQGNPGFGGVSRM
ncbi:hypothetical protein PHSY_001925 [Pseudozyma hubeiensis SY62]|uniref:methylcrotonoyl-CoA carboxylase n=1 Tax=Pseudozyma hubeiensis (strain SY62) TaxID=1305764 RepID=R9NZY6_PSEHS|nr:hypothetical protein PHSY_001925 [Pseudozyma hubeiensis SY62]GAC94354.1 hypothetical protein PHSY_001925 [Pseudozyma hubeiensis SY62]